MILMRIIGWIIRVITMIVMFAVLELNKNSLFGWFLAFLATAICFSLSVRYSGMKTTLLPVQEGDFLILFSCFSVTGAASPGIFPLSAFIRGRLQFGVQDFSAFVFRKLRNGQDAKVSASRA